MYFQDIRPVATPARGNDGPGVALDGKVEQNGNQTPKVPKVPAAPAAKTRQDRGRVIPTSAFILGCVGFEIPAIVWEFRSSPHLKAVIKLGGMVFAIYRRYT